METLKDLLDFVFEAIDAPIELEKTRQKYIQAHKCLNNYLQTGIAPDVKKKKHKFKFIKYFTLKIIQKIIQTFLGF